MIIDLLVAQGISLLLKSMPAARTSTWMVRSCKVRLKTGGMSPTVPAKDHDMNEPMNLVP